MLAPHRNLRGPSGTTVEDRHGNVGPTPETRAKAEPDVVDDLWRRGKLKLYHVNAARELRQVWEWVGRGMFPLSGMDGTPRAPKGTFAACVERMAPHEEAIWRGRFAIWCRRMGRLEAVVYKVVWDNRRPNDWNGNHEMQILRDGLQEYARLASLI